ncbi:MAG: DUF975 family protein [Oscillospiraceae bacterium]|nr:DUF975 family protein [Oscillospiraceae bacterium]MDY6208059.1 DUF975 family protein [Oscillospiraceae bacterium]
MTTTPMTVTMTAMRTKEIKARARELLRGCFAESAFISMLNIGLFLLTYLLIIIAGRVTGAHTAETLFPVFSSCPPLFIISVCVILLTAYILSAPIYYGSKWFFWQAAAGNTMPASSVFAGYSSSEQFKLCVKLRVLSDIRRVPYILIFGTAAVVEAVLAQRMLSQDADKSSAAFIYAGLAVVGAGVVYMCFFAGLRCVPVGFLLADNPDAVVTDIFELSEQVVKKNAGRLMKLYISFIGWFLACLPAFPIMILIPYFNVSMAVFLRDCLEETEKREEAAVKEEATV